MITSREVHLPDALALQVPVADTRWHQQQLNTLHFLLPNKKHLFHHHG